MFKLIEVSQKVTFDVNSNTSALSVHIPWATIALVALVGPFVVSGFRNNHVAPITQLRSVAKPAEDSPQVEI